MKRYLGLFQVQFEKNTTQSLGEGLAIGSGPDLFWPPCALLGTKILFFIRAKTSKVWIEALGVRNPSTKLEFTHTQRLSFCQKTLKPRRSLRMFFRSSVGSDKILFLDDPVSG